MVTPEVQFLVFCQGWSCHLFYMRAVSLSVLWTIWKQFDFLNMREKILGQNECHKTFILSYKKITIV